MRIPANAVIPEEKLTAYLLAWRPWDDKSRFLAQADFTQANAEALLAALRALAAQAEAVANGENQYGEFLRVEGELLGPNGVQLPVVTIWLRWRKDGTVHFVTLKPRRGNPA